MKTNKYKVTANVQIQKEIYVDAVNESEARFIAFCTLMGPTLNDEYVSVSGKRKSVEVLNSTLVEPCSPKFDIFGEDYCEH